ncbi:hypothetical protein CCACVL1_17260 [Corchorus capsularis]|uniref:Uncharacterized protein n=1 Tax=Corchorus capsularis TaxID=210143 RepID=A0A1R3HSZ5_COCAP|nr:hypothetical protein CCACVL1_17260 [Corchorus capsularis]
MEVAGKISRILARMDLLDESQC